MKKQANTRRGFTLIELLVVVLIIGILAAVALPQYQKAVKKARGREVIVTINALDKALALYALEHGEACAKVDAGHCISPSLDLEIPNTNYFVRDGVGVVTATSSANPVATFTTPDGNTVVEVEWDNVTGKRTSTLCSGNDCDAYFSCNSTIKRCNKQEWEESCPSHYVTEDCVLSF